MVGDQAEMRVQPLCLFGDEVPRGAFDIPPLNRLAQVRQPAPDQVPNPETLRLGDGRLVREVARVRPREVVERFVRSEVADREDVHPRRVAAEAVKDPVVVGQEDHRADAGLCCRAWVREHEISSPPPHGGTGEPPESRTPSFGALLQHVKQRVPIFIL